ncbi:MAG: TonB-dependent receptor, partial [Calditrichaeota bacterium]|nr:TonB-dependent receptor [Calditrichota bacterium]
DKKLDFHLQSEVIQLDPVIVTATLSEHKQSQVTTSAEVLTEAKLQEMTATTAAEAIESVGGLYVKNYDGLAGVVSPSIRGSNTNQVVVLLDGVRLNTGQGGGVDLNAFPVSALGTIEVVRGGHSALLGGDAIGGAIHLMSKTLNAASPLAFGFQSTVGSFSTRELNAFGAQRWGKFSYLIDFNHAQSDGNFEFEMPESGAKATRENNDYKGDNLFFKTGFDFNSGNKLQLIFHGHDSEKGVAGSVKINPWTGAPMTTPNARAENERRLVSVLSDNQIADRIRLQTNVFMNKNTFHYTNPDGWTPVDDKHENTVLGVNWRGIYYLTQTLKIQTGLEQRVEKLESTKFTVDDRNVFGAFVQLELNRAFSVAGKTAQ